jgi:hypothetical protein
VETTVNIGHLGSTIRYPGAVAKPKESEMNVGRAILTAFLSGQKQTRRRDNRQRRACIVEA